MSYVIQIEGLIAGAPTAFDGQYLVEYDPERDGVDPEGRPMDAHVVTTAELEEAQRFDSATDATECWRQVCERRPIRGDGRPNRPLTAFTVAILPEEKAR